MAIPFRRKDDETKVVESSPVLPDEAQTPDMQLILDGEFDQWWRLNDEFLAALDAAPSVPVYPGWAGKGFRRRRAGRDRRPTRTDAR